MNWILFVIIFIVVLAVIQSLFVLLRSRSNPGVGRLRMEIKALSSDQRRRDDVNIVKKRTLSEIPWFNEMLLNFRLPTLNRLEKLLIQADVRQSMGFFLLLSATFTVGAGVVLYLLSRNLPIAILIAILAAPCPWIWVLLKKRKRLEQFEKQLPDALDMIARSLKAGHAFNGGLQMVVMEYPDPVRIEFRKTLDEINFGVGYEDALRNMADRVDSTDLKFFALSVIIQRQSGGNLAEILEQISSLIRERFKLHGKVKALTGEARISAVVLSILPFAMAGVIFFLNPNYLDVLLKEPAGRVMVMGALTMMIAGILVMKRMVSIKV
ncbi:MAG TPA: type II secretion system F family protein [Syntrophales bacterium]|nr:type II secretion system F family protein [Syntrophales bacterium]